jgi:hypothetical protein
LWADWIDLFLNLCKIAYVNKQAFMYYYKFCKDNLW